MLMGFHQDRMPGARTGRRPSYLFVLPWGLEHPGGVNQVVISLARQMAVEGSYEPLVFIADWAARTPQWGEWQGIRTVRWRLRAPPMGDGLRQRLGFWLWRMRFSPAFRAFLRQQNVAVINPHNPTEAAISLEALARDADPKPRLLLSFHGSDINGIAGRSPAVLARWRQLATRVNALVSCSHDLARQVRAVLGRDAAVVHNGVDAPTFRAMAGPRPAGSRRSILNVGRFETKKGQDVLLVAFAALAGEHTDLDLVLVGAADSVLPLLRQRCAELEIGERVRFHPDAPHPQVALHMAAATVFALPSRVEAFGIVLLEAGALALPVVASGVGGIPEVVEEGQTARLVPPDDVAALTAALRALLADPHEARAMGRRLQDHVDRHFSWVRAHAQYIGLVRSCSAESSPVRDTPQST